jgi:hypothetical protein
MTESQALALTTVLGIAATAVITLRLATADATWTATAEGIPFTALIRTAQLIAASYTRRTRLTDNLAIMIASVAVIAISVVALLIIPAINLTVATGIPTLAGAAATEIAGHAARSSWLSTLFTGIDPIVAALFLFTRLRAPVATCRVAVVTLFSHIDRAIATESALLRGRIALAVYTTDIEVIGVTTSRGAIGIVRTGLLRLWILVAFVATVTGSNTTTLSSLTARTVVGPAEACAISREHAGI